MKKLEMIRQYDRGRIRFALIAMALILSGVGLTRLVAATAPFARDDSRSMAGTYTREFNGAGGPVTETLEIKADKTVTWTSNYPGRPALTQTGIWNARGETLVVVLDKRDGEKMPADERVVFDRRGKHLKGRIYDKNVHGKSGLNFIRSN